MRRGLWLAEGTKRTKWITGSLDTLDAVRKCDKCAISEGYKPLTQRPLRRVDEDRQVFMSETMHSPPFVFGGPRFERKRCMELNLTLNGEVVQHRQFVQ